MHGPGNQEDTRSLPVRKECVRKLIQANGIFARHKRCAKATTNFAHHLPVAENGRERSINPTLVALLSSMSRKGNCWDNVPIESWFIDYRRRLNSTGLVQLLRMSKRTPSTHSRAWQRGLVIVTVSLISNCSGGGSSSDTEINNVPRTAILVWDEVNAGNLTGYRVYFGTNPGTYIQPLGQGLNAGNVSNFTVTGLNRATRYYFSVTGFDVTSGFESGYSNEVFKDIP